MRHRKKSLKLGVKSDHRLAMMRNLTLGLVEHGRIKTTVGRAKDCVLLSSVWSLVLKTPVWLTFVW
jgi:ribosomal protein L17